MNPNTQVKERNRRKYGLVSTRLRDQMSRQPMREGHDGQGQVLVRQDGNDAAVADVEVVVVVGAQVAVHHAFTKKRGRPGPAE